MAWFLGRKYVSESNQASKILEQLRGVLHVSFTYYDLVSECGEAIN